MKKTFKELIKASMVIANMYKQDENLKDTKFGYAWKKFHAKNIEPTFKEYQEVMQDMYIDNALEDKVTQKIILDKESRTGFGHNKQQWKEISKEEKRISDEFDAKEVEIDPYISSYVPYLDEEQKEVLTGLII